VANTLKLYRNGAVGFIDLLGELLPFTYRVSVLDPESS
jgi:hypothetical protein